MSDVRKADSVTPATYLRALGNIPRGTMQVAEANSSDARDLPFGVYDQGGFRVARFATQQEAEQYVVLRSHASLLADVVEAAESHTHQRQCEDYCTWSLCKAYRRLAAAVAAVGGKR